MNDETLSKEFRVEECSSRASSGSGRRVSRELFVNSTATPRRRGETDDDFLARITHLRLQNKGISTLESGDAFEACPSLKVLYLYENCIESLRGLGWLRQLEHLYVDNNMLTSIDNELSSCRRLTKLHLSGNNISRVCGLESARRLEELHVATQRLPFGQTLVFVQASIDAVKDSLLVLDASGNGMTADDLEAVLELRNLESLNLADNAIEHMGQVVDLVTSLERLRNCDLRGNPVTRKPKYFERTLTRSGDSLKTLDGKPVHSQHREMLQKLDRHNRRKRAEARRRMDDRGSPSSTTSSSDQAAPIAEIGNIPSRAWVRLDEKRTVITSGATEAKRDVATRHSNSDHPRDAITLASIRDSGDPCGRMRIGPQRVWMDGQRAAVAVPAVATVAGSHHGQDISSLQLVAWPSATAEMEESGHN